MTNTLRLLVSRHSSFYTPLIATLAAGFLRAQGLDATYQVLPKGRHARDMIRHNEVDIVQAAVSSNWGPLEKGETDLPVHFAQINQRDGFFLAARAPGFQWKNLEGASLLADHGGQPLTMLKYAARYQGVDWTKIQVIDAGTPDEMDAAFRAGQDDYVHLQGPAPQQLEIDRIGRVAASVGEAMPPVAFSSLMAPREFLETNRARAFLRAYREAREWADQAPAGDVAHAESSFFPNVTHAALKASIARYQALGCWDGDATIARELYDQSLEVFLQAGAIARRHPYEQIVVRPPE